MHNSVVEYLVESIGKEAETMTPRVPTKELSIVGVFTAATVMLSQIAVPLPFTPVPLSLGLVAVYTTGILLPPKLAILVELCYLLLGAVGLPVFSEFRGGLGALFGPTGGYLLAYPLVAGLVSHRLRRKKHSGEEEAKDKTKHLVKATLWMGAALVLLYFFGTLWLSLFTENSFRASLALAVIPFVPLDCTKIIFCSIVIVPLKEQLEKSRYLQK